MCTCYWTFKQGFHRGKRVRRQIAANGNGFVFIQMKISYKETKNDLKVSIKNGSKLK